MAGDSKVKQRRGMTKRSHGRGGQSRAKAKCSTAGRRPSAAMRRAGRQWLRTATSSTARVVNSAAEQGLWSAMEELGAAMNSNGKVRPRYAATMRVARQWQCGVEQGSGRAVHSSAVAVYRRVGQGSGDAYQEHGRRRAWGTKAGAWSSWGTQGKRRAKQSYAKEMQPEAMLGHGVE